MLSAGDIATPEERQVALSLVPWGRDARILAGKSFGLLRNQAADVIDLAVGTVHARAAVVSMQEGADALLQVALDLVESSLSSSWLARIDALRDPLGSGEELQPPEQPERLRKRAIRVPVEAAAVRLAAAGNHLVNAHLRLAWEANAATNDEVVRCGFDPESNRYDNWADAARMAAIDAMADTAVLPHFVLTQAWRAWAGDPDVLAVREVRHRVIHRDRPSYADAPAIGRDSLWDGGSISVTFRPFEPAAGSEPSLADVSGQVSRGAAATLVYAEQVWEVALRWLETVGVRVSTEPGTVTVQADIPGPRRAREARDPGPFLTESA